MGNTIQFLVDVSVSHFAVFLFPAHKETILWESCKRFVSEASGRRLVWQQRLQMQSGCRAMPSDTFGR